MRLFKGQNLFTWLGKKIESAEVTEQALLDTAKQLYVKELALYTAVGLLADIVGKCERQVFRNGQLVQDGTWYRLNVDANPNQSAEQLITQWIINLYYQGHALIVPLSGQLYVADSFQIQEYPIRGNVFQNISVGNVQLRKIFNCTDVFYITQGDRSVRRLVDGIFIEYSELLAASMDAYKRSSGEKYALNIGHKPSGTPEQQRDYLDQIKQNLQKFIDSSKAGYPLTKDQELTLLSTGGKSSSGTTDILNLRKDVYSVVASALHIPESLLYGNMTNVDQIINQTLTFAVGPLTHKLSTELTRKTFTEKEILSGGCRVAIDTTRIQHIDIVTMADKIDKLISSGVFCIDEARDACNLPRLNTEWSRRHFITKNYADVEDTLDPLEGGEMNE